MMAGRSPVQDVTRPGSRTMRNTLRIGGLLLVLAAMVMVGRSFSETKDAPRPKLRIGLVNIGHVAKHYGKVKELSDDIKKTAEPYSLKLRARQAEADRLT